MMAGIFLFVTCALGGTSNIQQAVQNISNNLSEANDLPNSTIVIHKDKKPNILYSTDESNRDILVTHGMIYLVDNQDQLAFELASMYAIRNDKSCHLDKTDKDLCLDVKALEYMMHAGYNLLEGINMLGKLIDITDNDPNMIKRYLFLQAYIQEIK